MRLTDFKVLTFDCYGTLIDWEAGLLAALEPLLALRDRPIPREEVLETFAGVEAAQEEATPQLPYRDVLTAVHSTLAASWGVADDRGMAERFGASVGDWPAFPDSVAALRYLEEHYRLVVLSNVDRVSFNGSSSRLEVEFDAVYTAEEIGSYKPDPRNFDYLVEHVERDLGLAAGDILHTAQSLFHDHVPAARKGLATAWIDRRHDREGWGATKPPAAMPRPDFRFDSLGALVAAHRRESQAAGSAPDERS